MSSRRDNDYLEDMREAMQRIIAYTEGLTYQDFLIDIKTQDSVIRNLQVVGEAAKRVSSVFRKAHPILPWKEMAGLRDKVVHDHFGIRHSIIWAVARQELIVLLPQIEALLVSPLDHE